MENWLEMVITGATLIVAGLFMWRVYPVVKDNAIYKKALEIVYQMEEVFGGGGTGSIKFDKAVSLLQSWVGKLGWKVDVSRVIDTVTSAVGALHAQQGKVPTEPKNEEVTGIEATE